tara:strand:- start:467 stop:655 length:189 start_codon:yes stop_codon:yes gene_type:complete
MTTVRSFVGVCSLSSSYLAQFEPDLWAQSLRCRKYGSNLAQPTFCELSNPFAAAKKQLDCFW